MSPTVTEKVPQERKEAERWRWLTIGEIAAEVRYGTSSKTNQDADGVPVIRMGNIQEGTIVLNSLKYLPASHHEFPQLLLEPGDLLFNRTNSAELVGKCAVYKGNPSCASFASYLIRVRLKAGFLPEYIAFYINSSYGREWIKSVVSQQVGQANVNGTKLKNLQIPLPPLDEQRRIVEEIEQQFTRLDAGVAALRSAQTKLKRYRAAVLKTACEGKLVPTEAEIARKEGRSYETGEELLQRIFGERRKSWPGRGKYKEVIPPDAKDLLALPEGWTWASLDQVCVKITDGTHHSPKNFAKGDFLYITSKNVREFRLDLSDVTYIDKDTHDEIYARCDVREDDVLYVKDGANTGLAAKNTIREPFSLLSSVGVFRPISLVAPDYLVAYLNSKATRDRMLSKIAGVAITRLTLSKLKISAIAVPPLGEQTRIVAEVERRISVVEEMEAVVSASLHRAVRQRQSILQNAFTGALT